MPLRITLVIHGLTAGGAERQISIMANYWAEHGVPVTLVTGEDPSRDFYKVDPAVTRAYAMVAGDDGGPASGVTRLIAVAKRLVKMRSEIIKSKPDVVISFIDEMNVRVLLAMRFSKIPIIVSERNNPHMRQGVRPEFARLRLKYYHKASMVTVQTNRGLEFFGDEIKAKGAIVPNPVFLRQTFDSPNEEAIRNAHKVIAMGRLHPQKGFERLIEAFASIADRFPDWTLEIWGEGNEEAMLRDLVEKSGYKDRISLPGKTSEPFEKMRESSLFVLSSRYEGFPNVLCEAMACGLPVVSFDCETGPSEVIRDGYDGLLVPDGDVPALAQAMANLMNDPDQRLKLATNAPEVLQRFHIDRVMAIWDGLIQRVRTKA